MGTETPERPAWPSRLLAVTFYLGLAPLLALLRLHRRNTYLQHHYTQAVALVGLLACILLSGLIGFVAIAYLIVYHEDVHATYLPGATAEVVFAVPLVLWALAWLLAVGLALKGSVRAVPVLGRHSGSRRTFRAALVGNIGLGLVVTAVASVTLHALAITSADARPAPVYMLYDSGNVPVPRWVFALGFYRISLAAQARWGPDSVVVAPLTEENLHQAMQHGRFVYLGSHGNKGDVTCPHLLVMPVKGRFSCNLWSLSRASTSEPFNGKHVRRVEVGSDLQFVYVSACGSGDKGEIWQEALTPAVVRTFPRTSAVGEHILWMWLDGPDRVQEIK